MTAAERPISTWIDNHCHLPADADEATAVVAAARDAGVIRLIDVGTDLERSAAACLRAERFTDVFATVGLHPHDASNGLDGFEALLSHPAVVAVGECGLDYYYDHSPREIQRAAFADQVELALQHDLALVIHTRDAWSDTFDVLDAVGLPERTVFHCFTGGPDEARAALDRGAYLSFSGIVTFKNAPEVREAAALAPSDRYLVETDAPYLAPVPNRGKKNRPAWVTLVGAGVAAARGISSDLVASESWANASDVYRLD